MYPERNQKDQSDKVELTDQTNRPGFISSAVTISALAMMFGVPQQMTVATQGPQIVRIVSHSLSKDQYLQRTVNGCIPLTGNRHEAIKARRWQWQGEAR
jgi:hypothetical protein